MHSSLRNCPPQFYENCSNAIKKCRVCSAGAGQDTNRYETLAYQPIEPSLDFYTHPQAIKVKERKRAKEVEAREKKRNIDKEKSRMSRQGRAQEKTSASRLNKLVTQTVNSGATFNDGDLKALGGLIQIDSKLRHIKRSFTVTWDEYTSGLQQGTNSWLITVKDKDNKPHSLACLTEDTFAFLLTSAAQTQELKERCQKLEEELKTLKSQELA